MFEELQAALGNRYRLERELGGGGMSRVYLATEVALGRQVVVKVLAPELASATTAARFKREAELTAQLQHPHILPVLSAEADAGLLYYISPYVTGESLRHRMVREGRLPIDECLRILDELASALAYAHERGVVHRDIKPENVLLSNGHAVLADFGISARPERAESEPRDTRLTAAGTSLGTPGYMSPEQAAGESNLDGRSDQYSLAVVGFEMLAGRPPFEGQTPSELVVKHLTQPAPAVTRFRGEVPPGIAATLSRAMAKAPKDRFASASDFRAAVRHELAAGETPSAARLGRRWGGGAAVVAAAVAVGGYVLWGRGPAPSADVASSRLVAIAPFDAIGPEARMWREGMVDLLAANLDGAGSLRTVSTTAVMRKWPDSARADRSSALELARQLHAGLAVYGTAVPAGRDSLRLRVNIIDAVHDTQVGSEIEIVGDGSRIDLLSDTLAIALLTELNSARGIGATKRQSLGSASLPAIKAFLWGETHYRRGSWDSASAHYREALAADSLYASAMWRLGNAMGWKLAADLRPDVESYRLLLRAGALNKGLTPRESVLVAADSLFAALMLSKNDFSTPQRYRQTVRMTQLMESAAARFGDDPEIWYKLGDVRFHFTRDLARSLPNAAAARNAFEQAVLLDSTFAPAYPHLIELTGQAQDLPAMRRSMGNYLRLHPSGEQAEAIQIVASALAVDSPRMPNVDSLLAARRYEVLRNLASTVQGLHDSDELALRMLRPVYDWAVRVGISGEMLLAMRWPLVAALSMRGHFAEMGRIATDEMASQYYFGALAGAIPADSMDRLADRFARSNDPLQRGIALLWWTERRDTTRANALLARLQAKGARANIGFLQPFLPAMQALLSGDTARAEAAFGIPDSACLAMCASADFLRLRLLSAQRKDSAARALLDRPMRFEDAAQVLWNLERGRVYERLNERPRAIDAYAYVVSAWEHGDPSVQPLVDEARAGLRRLASDRPR